MPRQRTQITEEQVQALQQAFASTRDGATRIRYQAVRLYFQGYPVAEICQITGSSRTSLMEWCRKFRQQSTEALADHRGGRHRARLTLEQIEALSERLRLYTPRALFGAETHTASGQHWTVEDLARTVQRWYGVSWQSRVSYHSLFTQCGFTYQRTEKVYKSRREQDVSEFEAAVEKNWWTWPRRLRTQLCWPKTSAGCTCKPPRWQSGRCGDKPR
jgi:transposase